jgi:hypothetical protein
MQLRARHSFVLIGAGAKYLLERAIGGCDAKASVDNDACTGHGLENLARRNIG